MVNTGCGSGCWHVFEMPRIRFDRYFKLGNWTLLAFFIVGLQLYLEKTHLNDAISGAATGMNIYIVLSLKSQQGAIER